MHLTLHTDYGLRVLIYLALLGEQRGTIREVAEHYGISRNHLMKVAHRLQQLGYVEGVRGKGGGLSLALSANEIPLGRFVRDMEPDLLIAECFGPDNRCVITPHCNLRGFLNEALQSFLDTLDGYTLADITQGREKALRTDLGITWRS